MKTPIHCPRSGNHPHAAVDKTSAATRAQVRAQRPQPPAALAAEIDNSPRVRALAYLKEQIQQGAGMRGLSATAPSVQLVAAGSLAHSERQRVESAGVEHGENLNRSSEGSYSGRSANRVAQPKLERPSHAVQSSEQAPVIQRVIYPNMNALLTAVLGAAPPAIGAFSAETVALFNDAALQLPHTDVISNAALGRVAEASVNPAPPPNFILEFDPNEPDRDFLVASVLHELIHVSSERNYNRGGLGGVPGLDWLNLNLPGGLAGAAIGNELGNQRATLTANLTDAVNVAQNDATLAAPMQNHILNRLNNYALVMPNVHYDTVLADILAYMELQGVNHGSTFQYIRRLVREANDRRLVHPAPGIKRARRVNTAAPWPWQW